MYTYPRHRTWIIHTQSTVFDTHINNNTICECVIHEHTNKHLKLRI